MISRFRRTNLLLFILISAQSLVHAQESQFSEDLEYQIKYGWIPIGKATVSHQVSERSLDIDVLAYTTGVVNWIARLRDSIRTEIHPKSLKPIKSFIDRREGKFRRKEINHFDYIQDSVEVLLYDQSLASYQRAESVYLKENVFDMVSTYSFLRYQLIDQMAAGDSILVEIFYEGKYYDFGIEYIGKSEIDIQSGTFDSHEFYLLFPISKTFPKSQLVKIWVTADDRRLPLLIEAKMKFGKARCELVSSH